MKKTTFDKLTTNEQILVKAAQAARKNAYAPYSNYKVGAAVMAENNKIYSGCNVEIATFSRTTHAEGNAIDTMVADGARKILALCCLAKNGGIPCAECRQKIWEFCQGDKNVKIIGADLKGNIVITTIGEIYPYPFGPEDLK